ncbi:efflux RND transporter periplasmic adaptor subunit [Mariniflexile litorale]|uniref:Efflux RND transporter periplasmic adaptor subunit n=1 Tax=Mariniflexile litorale TaxID=3045158 RepID=A0AAU7EEN8_9FLAO|nr:efflux RND transporter periplasmic adaptor subunit [Mariniflexile sp. KMM 9835]MDQ8211641.1 efflux RND transporter periplasmic adaptor subunit [Mariniflexile sp. KMM 9835]
MKNIIYKIMLSIVLVLAIGCKEKPTNEVEGTHKTKNENIVELTEAQLAQTEISIGKVKKRKIGHEITVNGVIDVPPQNNISVTVPYGGFLKQTTMLSGTRLKKGQIIASVENPEFIEFQRAYLEALANNEYLKADFERQETLNKEEVTSTKVFQKAKSSYLTNKANIQALESKLRLIGINPLSVKNGKIASVINVYSPINGIVREVYINRGKYFNPQDVLMDITNASDLHVELKVYENDIHLIRVGQRIRFRLANAPDTWMEAKVFLIGNNVRNDRSITIHGHLKEENEALLPGMFINANIEVEAVEQYAIPEEAIVRFEGKHYIFTSLGKRKEGVQMMHDYEMLEIIKGNEEENFVAFTFEDPSQNVSKMDVVLKDAFTLLAKAKNSEEEGHGH